MRVAIVGLLVVIFLTLHVARVETAYRWKTTTACVTEDAMLQGVKMRFPHAYRAKVFVGKGARDAALYSTSIDFSAVDKATVVETGDESVSIAFFQKDCKVSEVFVPRAKYMGIMYMLGQFPGTLLA